MQTITGTYNENKTLNFGCDGFFEEGSILYVKTNHLGNVLVTVTDRRNPIESQITSGEIAYYEADIATAQDYYPFGMLQPGRSLSTGEYRFGFNSKEMDIEWNSTGNMYDYGFRIYDPRIAKFLSVDPLSSTFPWYTPYQFAGNKPIYAVDLDGLEEFEARYVYQEELGGYLVTLKLIDADKIDLIIHREYVTTNNQGQEIVTRRTGHEYSSDRQREIAESQFNPDNQARKADGKSYLKQTQYFHSLSEPESVDPTEGTNPIRSTEDRTQFRVGEQTIQRGSAIQGSVNFTQNSARRLTNRNEAVSEIQDIADAMISSTDINLTIRGNVSMPEGATWESHTTIDGNNGTYEDLALARANAIKTTLVRLGVDESRVNVELGSNNQKTATYEFE